MVPIFMAAYTSAVSMASQQTAFHCQVFIKKEASKVEVS